MCPWTLARSWEQLSTSFSFLLFLFSLFLSFSLSLFLSFSLSFLPLPSCLGVPGCFRHSLLLLCVLGRLCRSWEHLPFMSFLLFFLLFSPYPSLHRARPVHIQKTLQPVFKSVLVLVSSICFPFHPSPSHTFVLLFSFVSSCLHVLAFHSFSLLCTHRPRP